MEHGISDITKYQIHVTICLMHHFVMRSVISEILKLTVVIEASCMSEPNLAKNVI